MISSWNSSEKTLTILAVQDLETTKEGRDTVRPEVHGEDESAEVWQVSIDFEML